MNNSRSPSTDNALQRLPVQLRTVKQVYKRTGKRLAAWWEQQGEEQRRHFLLEWCPFMPLARDKPYLYVDGKKEDVQGAAMITPEFNQEELLQGKHFLDVIREVAEVPDEHEPGGSPGYDAFTELCLRNIPTAQALVGRIKTKLSREQVQKGVATMIPGADFGKIYIVKQMVPSIKNMLAKGAMVPAPCFEALMMRLDVLLSSVAMCLDHYRVEVLGRKQYSAIGPQMGCGFCGAIAAKAGEGSGSGKLQACAACGVVFYCSKACQKADWKEHKPHCKLKEMRDKEAADRAAPRAGGTAATAAAAATAPAAEQSTAAEAQGSAAAAAASPDP